MGRQRKPRSPLDKANAYEVVWAQVSGVFDAAREFDDVDEADVSGEAEDGPLKIGLSKDPIALVGNMATRDLGGVT
jgi:hypothetical protein